jgi:hypothetical protein
MMTPVAKDVRPGELKVVYVAGMLRSGTTLMSAALGALPGAATMGETVVLWQAAAERRVCTCLTPLPDCEVWGPVLDEVLSTFPEFHGPSDIHALVTSAIRIRRARRLARAPESDRDSQKYAAVLACTYRAFSRVTGASIVVDASKSPAVAALLPLIPGAEPSVVHLIRDPRAVAASEGAAETRSGVDPSLAPPVRGPLRSALTWDGYNLAADLVARHQRERLTWVRLRYEQFVAAPKQAFDTLTGALGLNADTSPFVGDRELQLPPTHEAAGNPNRFEGQRRIINPAVGRAGAALRPHERALVSAVTLPVRLRLRGGALQ